MVKIILSLFAALLTMFAVDAQAKTITDIFGRKVDVPDRVERIVALGSTMSFVTYLKAQNLAVGVEDYDKKEKFTKPYIYVNREAVKDLPVVAKGGPARSVNIEAVIGVRPDVVFLNSLDQNEAEQLQTKLRIPVVALSYGLPEFELNTFYASLRVTGDVLGKQNRAAELIKYTDGLLKELAQTKSAGKRAYIGGISFKGFHGIDSTSADFIPFKMAKIVNAADVTGKQGQIFVNKEFIIGMNPPLIFIDGNGLAMVKKNFDEDKQFYSRLNAFNTGEVYLVLPDTSYFVNPEVMFANAFVMAKAAYPSQFAKMIPEKKADEIFTFFNGKPLYKLLEADAGGYKRVKISDGEMVFDNIKAK